MSYRKPVPKMNVGRYAGTPIDQLPNSYLRWMIGQRFPAEWMEIAKRKLKESDWSNEYVHVTRHALDMFSKRFIDLWIASNVEAAKAATEAPGLATFVARLAQDAWDNGADVSKRRHQDDGIAREKDGIKWVFSVNTQFPDYREVITVIPSDDRRPVWRTCPGCLRKVPETMMAGLNKCLDCNLKKY